MRFREQLELDDETIPLFQRFSETVGPSAPRLDKSLR